MYLYIIFYEPVQHKLFITMSEFLHFKFCELKNTNNFKYVVHKM